MAKTRQLHWEISTFYNNDNNTALQPTLTQATTNTPPEARTNYNHLSHLSRPPVSFLLVPFFPTQQIYMKKILQNKSKPKPGVVQQPLGMAEDEQHEPFAYTQTSGLHRPTPVPNDTSSMSRGVSSQSSMASIGEEPASADEGSDTGSLSNAPSLHRHTPMPAATSSGDRSRKQGSLGLPPLTEEGGLEAEVTPGVPLLVHTRSIEGRTRSPSPDLRRVSPKVGGWGGWGGRWGSVGDGIESNIAPQITGV